MNYGKRMLTEREVTARTGLSRGTLRDARRTPDVPRHVKTSAGAVRYPEDEVMKWEAERKARGVEQEAATTDPKEQAPTTRSSDSPQILIQVLGRLR